ncbi:hypothetical protein LSAT2_014313, partial [Lamellibrachia satsuma]
MTTDAIRPLIDVWIIRGFAAVQCRLLLIAARSSSPPCGTLFPPNVKTDDKRLERVADDTGGLGTMSAQLTRDASDNSLVTSVATDVVDIANGG